MCDDTKEWYEQIDEILDGLDIVRKDASVVDSLDDLEYLYGIRTRVTLEIEKTRKELLKEEGLEGGKSR
ncbi:MAG: hypothetical protein KAX31_04615 [Thermoplasmata archaeon]|nr:hypothetical protein [Thermoplasmata archaeon]